MADYIPPPPPRETSYIPPPPPRGPVRIDFGPKKELTPYLDALGIADPTILPDNIDEGAPRLAPKKKTNILDFATKPGEGTERMSILTAQNPDEMATVLGIDPTKMNATDKQKLYDAVRSRNINQRNGPLGALGSGIARGLYNIPQKVEQGVSHLFAAMIPSSPELVSSKNLSDAQVRADKFMFGQHNQNYPGTAEFGQAIGETPYFMALPGGSVTSKGVQMAERTAGDVVGPMLQSGVRSQVAQNTAKTMGSGFLAGASQPITGGDFGRQTLTQGLTGMVAAPVAQYAGERLLQPLLAKATASVKGELPQPYANRQAFFDQQNIPALASDLVSDPASGLNQIAHMATNAPAFGIGKANAQQALSASDSVTNLVNGLRARAKSIPFTGEAEVATAAAAGDKQAIYIQGLFDAAKQSGEPGATAKAELNAVLRSRRQQSDALYKAKEHLAPIEQNDPAPIRDAILSELQTQESLGANKNKELVNYLNQALKDFGGEPGTLGHAAQSQATLVVPPGQERLVEMLRAAGKNDAEIQSALVNLGVLKPTPASSSGVSRSQQLMAPGSVPQTVDTSYGGLSKYASGVGNKRQDFFKPGSIGNEETNALGRLERAIKDYQSKIAKQSGNEEFAAADATASSNYRTQIAEPFEHDEVKAILKELTPDVQADKFTSYTSGQTGAVAGVMGPRGHLAMTQNAIESIVKDMPKGYVFSPKEFAKQVQGKLDSIGVTAGPEDLALINEFADNFSRLNHAGVTPAKNPLQNLMYTSALGGATGHYLGIPSAIAAGGAFLGRALPARGILQTGMGKSFALTPGTSPIISESANPYVRRFMDQVTGGSTGMGLGEFNSGENPAYKTYERPQ